MKSYMLLVIGIVLYSLVVPHVQALKPAAKTVSTQPHLLNENVCVEKTILYYDNGVIRKCKLKKPTTIQSYPCERWVRFYQNARLEQFEISETLVVQSITIPARSTVFLNRDGTLHKTWFSDTMTIQGIPCKGARIGKVTTAFYENGALQWCFLAEPRTIQGIPCKSSPMDIVGFHSDGTLKTCTLEQPTVLQGQVYTRGMKIYLDDSGKILPES